MCIVIERKKKGYMTVGRTVVKVVKTLWLKSIIINFIPVQFSSWMHYVAIGTKLLVHAINHTLIDYQKKGLDFKIEECKWEFYKAVYEKINTETFVLEFYGSEPFKIHFSDATIHTAYELNYYNPKINKTSHIMIGEVSRQGYNITSEQPDLTKLLKDCSVTCRVGQRRIFYTTHAQCCWKCEGCPDHTISTTNNSDLCTECELDNQTSSLNNTKCVPVDIDYLKPEYMVFRIAVMLLTLSNGLTLFIFIVIIIKRQRPIVKASDTKFCYLFILGIQLLEIGTMFTIAKPTFINCTLEYTLAAGSTSLITSTLVLRCFKIHVLFSSTTVDIQPRLALFLTTTGQTIIYLALFSTNVILAVFLIFYYSAWNVDNIQVAHEPVFMICTTASYVDLLPFLIPSICFITALILSFRMRNYPHNFRETKSIFLATMIIFIAYVTFCTGYSFSSAAIKAFIRCVVCVSTSIALLSCIFLPKVVVLLKTTDSMLERIAIKAAVSSFTERNVILKNENTVNSISVIARKVILKNQNTLNNINVNASKKHNNGVNQPMASDSGVLP